MAAGLLFTVTSCEKRHDPNNGTILRRSVMDNNDSVITTNYVYDERGRLVRLQISTRWLTNAETNEALLLDFNNTGRLARSYNADAGNSTYNIQEYTYRSNSDTIDVLYTPYRWLPPSYTRMVIRNSFGQVTGDSLRPVGGGPVSFSTFTYDAAGNVTARLNGTVENGNITESHELLYTYDARFNPFKTFGLPYYLATGDFRAFNSTNIQSWAEGSQRYTWQYSYNINNLPLQSVLPIAGGNRKYNYYYR